MEPVALDIEMAVVLDPLHTEVDPDTFPTADGDDTPIDTILEYAGAQAPFVTLQR